MRVFVYRNLHKDCWSVKALEGEHKGRVIYHAQNVTLSDCTFKVSKAGRERVLRERRKNVHAGVVGQLGRINVPLSYMPQMTAVTYNPYKYESFVRKNNDFMPVHNASWVYMGEDKNVGAILYG
jgi:hypothetical protein